MTYKPKNLLKVITAMATSLALIPIYAAHEYSIVCPNKVDISKLAKEKNSDWQIYNFQNNYDRITFYSGDPRNFGNYPPSLAPDISNSVKATWRFNAKDLNYVGCGYNQSKVQLIQRLAKNTVSCTVWYDHRSSGHLKKIKCFVK